MKQFYLATQRYGAKMSELFCHGYALLVGVGECEYPQWSLPATARDAQAIRACLIDPSLCAYPDSEAHVRMLHNSSATYQAILQGLEWLQECAAHDLNATVFVYYSGHGWLDELSGDYYLIPHDADPTSLHNSALAAQIFTDSLRAIAAKRLLIIIDSCHAEGMATSKGESRFIPPENFIQGAMPKSVTNVLSEGQGRAVFTSSRGNQLSWVYPGQKISLYTYHLLEAFQGAGNHVGDNVVRISNLINYLGKTVSNSARQLLRVEQTPFFDTATEDFAVAKVQGGKGLPNGGWESIQDAAHTTIERLVEPAVINQGGIIFGAGANVNARNIFVGSSTEISHSMINIGIPADDSSLEPSLVTLIQQSLKKLSKSESQGEIMDVDAVQIRALLNAALDKIETNRTLTQSETYLNRAQKVVESVAPQTDVLQEIGLTIRSAIDILSKRT